MSTTIYSRVAYCPVCEEFTDASKSKIDRGYWKDPLCGGEYKYRQVAIRCSKCSMTRHHVLTPAKHIYLAEERYQELAAANTQLLVEAANLKTKIAWQEAMIDKLLDRRRGSEPERS